MQFYEHIPNIVQAAVRSLYRESFIDLRMHAPARLLESINSSDVTANISLLLSQVALVLSVVLAAFIVFVAFQRRALRSQSSSDVLATPPSDKATAPMPTGMLRDRWNSILQHLDSTHEGQWKLAVIEADKLVDDALAKSGFPGATFGDRLSNIQPGTLLSLDGIWWAHKVRNRLAHEIDYFLRYTEARQAVGYYEAALAELQLI